MGREPNGNVEIEIAVCFSRCVAPAGRDKRLDERRSRIFRALVSGDPRQEEHRARRCVSRFPNVPRIFPL